MVKFDKKILTFLLLDVILYTLINLGFAVSAKLIFREKMIHLDMC